MEYIHLGRLVESEPTRVVYFCDQDGFSKSHIGSMIAIDLPNQQIVCGIITGQHWMSDEFVARMAQIRGLDSAITEDHRWSRSGGPAIECRIVGVSGPHVRHSLPRQALSALSPVRLCSQDEMISFTAHGWHYLSYLIAGAVEPASADVLAAHIQDVHSLLQDGGHQWVDGATRFLIRSRANRPDDLGLILQAIAERFKNG
jgi:hypothetical protein